MDNKNNLRAKAKEIRKTLNIKKISKKIIDNLVESDLYKNANNIMLFYPKDNEIDLRELFSDTTKKIFLPRVNGDKLEVCPYKKGEPLTLSEFKVFEPASCPVPPDTLDLIIVPALMADINGYRLGYGGGYYDRFLKNVLCDKVICISDELVIDNLPINEFDIRCDCLITQTIKKSLRLRG